MKSSVLFVCLGNICRSPAAEAVMRSRLPDPSIRIASAGTSNWHIGDPPYGPMVRAAALRGVAMDGLKARQFVPQDFAEFDLVIGMDLSNLSTIERLRPPGSKTPVELLLSFAGSEEQTEVPDPYYTRNFDEALDLVEAGIDGLIEQHFTR